MTVGSALVPSIAPTTFGARTSSSKPVLGIFAACSCQVVSQMLGCQSKVLPNDFVARSSFSLRCRVAWSVIAKSSSSILKWSRGQVEARLANMPPCLIGMEACVGAHHLVMILG